MYLDQIVSKSLVEHGVKSKWFDQTMRLFRENLNVEDKVELASDEDVALFVGYEIIPERKTIFQIEERIFILIEEKLSSDHNFLLEVVSTVGPEYGLFCSI